LTIDLAELIEAGPAQGPVEGNLRMVLGPGSMAQWLGFNRRLVQKEILGLNDPTIRVLDGIASAVQQRLGSRDHQTVEVPQAAFMLPLRIRWRLIESPAD
jgi:hypothetical protein